MRAWNAGLGDVIALRGGIVEGAAVEGRAGLGQFRGLDVPALGAGWAEALGEFSGAAGAAALRPAQPDANRPSEITTAAVAMSGRAGRRAARRGKRNAMT
jgi:hypothetical protein